MKVINKIGVILLSICLVVPMFCLVSQAANGSVSISSTSGKVGSTVTVKCSVKSQSGAIGSVDMVVTYDQSALQYVSGSDGTNGGSGRVQYVAATTSTSATTLSFSMKFKILKEGTHTISSGGIEAYTLDEQLLSIGGTSGRVTGKSATATTDTPQEDTRDKNNKLSSMQASVGTLEPAFHADTTTYTLTVPEDTTDVTISATAQSSKAQVAVTGGTTLRLGANAATVTVTAENGEVLTYTITIMCGEAEKIQINGSQHTFNYDFTDEQIPAGFTRTKVTYNGREYEAVTNANNSIQLVNLQNGEATAFYIYKQETKEFLPFVQVILSEGKYIIPLALDAKFEQFEENERTTIAYADKQFDAWKLDDEFSVAYAMNQDGEQLLYRYDAVDGVFQRYVEAVEETTIFPSEYYMYAIVGLGTLSIILLISMIYFIASRKARHEGRKRKAIKRMEKQRAKEEKRRLKEEADLERIREEERIAQEKQRAKEEKQRAKEEKKLAKKNEKNRDE